MKTHHLIMIGVLTFLLISCVEKKALLKHDNETFSSTGLKLQTTRTGKLDDAAINQYVFNGDLDRKGINFQSLPGAKEFLTNLDLTNEEIELVGSWYNENSNDKSVRFYPNRLINYYQMGPYSNLLGFIGFWKVINGNVMVKIIGYFYTEKTEAILADEINAGKYKTSPIIITIYDFTKLYRYENPVWNEFLDLKDLDVANYTYRGFIIPPIPNALEGKKNVEISMIDGRMLRLTSDVVNNQWTDIINNAKYATAINENISDELLLEYFRR